MTTSLYDLDYQELVALLGKWGLGGLEARVVWEAVYRRCIARLDAESGIDAALRSRLLAEVPLRAPASVASQEDPNGDARKDLIGLEDGNCIEVVLLRYRERRSVCVSTQIGCACGCRFCATGQSGFVRQLSSGEIVAQVVHVQRTLLAQGCGLSNVVLMGMGEPLLNYQNTIDAIRRVADQRGLAIPQRRITLSTVGIAPAIRRLARENLQVGLAVSLHAASDALRNELVPMNRTHNLAELSEAMRSYATQTGRRVLVEWTLIEQVNDSPEQARQLAGLLRGTPAHVNLIRLNETTSYEGRASPPRSVDRFAAVLGEAGIPHTMRQRRGSSILAGCGQLQSSRRLACP